MKSVLIAILLICCVASIGLSQENPASIEITADKLTLDKSVQIAFDQSPVILKTKADIKAAEAVAGQAVAGFLPQLSLSAGVGKYHAEPMNVEITMLGSPSVFSYGTNEEGDVTNYSASLSQAVFTGGKLMSSVSMANKGLDIARQELRRITQEVKYNVISAYYGVLKAQGLVKLSEQSVKMAQNHLARINALLKAGMTTRADVLRGEVQVAQAELALTRAKQGLDIAQNSFNNTIGRDLETLVVLKKIEYDPAKIEPYYYKEVLVIAYDNRPDWIQYVLSKKITKDEVGLAYSGLWPMLSLVGNYDVNSTKYPSYQSDSTSWTAMLSGTWNVFDGTSTWHKINEAKAKVEAGQADETNVKRGVALEVKDANFAIKSSLEGLRGANKAQELAEENHNIAELRYDSGVGTNLEVIDAQVALTQAGIDQLTAQYDLLLARAKLNKVVGKEIY